MAYHPFIKGLADILSVNEVQTESALKVFIDDTNLAAKFPKMRESIRHMITEGSKIGFKFNSKKGAYLLAACPSDLEAIYNCLIDEFGLHPDIIRIHPTTRTLVNLYMEQKFLEFFLVLTHTSKAN